MITKEARRAAHGSRVQERGTDMEDVVESLETAKSSDTVWLWDPEATRLVNGKYAGRGVWRTAIISSETRASFVVRGEKFDRATGNARTKNGFNTGMKIAGALEYEDDKWKRQSYNISQMVCSTIGTEKLKAVAEIVGFTMPEEDTQ